MASRSVSKGLSEAYIREQLALAAAPGKPLFQVWLDGPVVNGALAWRASCYLLRCRAGGFMVIAPFDEQIVTYLGTFLDTEDVCLVATHEAPVMCESPRGREVDSQVVLLADFPWSCAQSFKKAAALRLTGIPLFRFMAGEAVVRPQKVSAWEASEEWIVQLDQEEPFLEEYVTAAEEVQFVEAEAGDVSHHDAQDQADLIRQLQARIVDLETRHETTPHAQPQYNIQKELFPTTGAATLDAQTWAKLQAAAGPAPTRVGRQESASRLEQSRGAARSSQIPSFLDQEVAAEAVDADELGALMDTMSDPLHKLLALQLRQNQEMFAKMMPKQPADAITSALAGSANEYAGSSSGVKGCTAREAYVKQVEDSSHMAKCTMRNAMKDLGVLEAYPGLMRDYVEKKIPLGDMKLLTMFAYFQAHTWEAAYLAKDELMMGYAARGLLFVEQCAVDAGKTQMGWLLSGLPDPNYALVSQNRKRAGLQPFAHLAQASWIAANVAFLKDLDFMENRLRNAGPKATKDAEGDGDKTDKPVKKPWPKRKGKPDKPVADGPAA